MSKRRNEFGEFVVKWIENGRVNDAKSYHTDDWDDAVGTMRQMKQQAGISEDIGSKIRGAVQTVVHGAPGSPERRVSATKHAQKLMRKGADRKNAHRMTKQKFQDSEGDSSHPRHAGHAGYWDDAREAWLNGDRDGFKKARALARKWAYMDVPPNMNGEGKPLMPMSQKPYPFGHRKMQQKQVPTTETASASSRMMFEKGGYYFWKNHEGYWNVTKSADQAPKNFAYASAEAIAKLKNIRL